MLKYIKYAYNYIKKNIKYIKENSIYEGFYYPVIGNNSMWSNRNTGIIMSTLVGGYGENYDKWWTFHWGIKCKFKNPNKPFKQSVIDAIERHPSMVIEKYLITDEQDPNPIYMDYVNTKSGLGLGDIAMAASLLNLNEFKTYRDGVGKQVCCGYDRKTKIYYGWSHRAKVGFEIGDKIFEEDFGDDSTLYKQHGSKTIETKADQLKAARAFAESVA
jgi:hypothetical protein